MDKFHLPAFLEIETIKSGYTKIKPYLFFISLSY